MNNELIKYFIEQCREWMLPEEEKALKRFTYTPNSLEETRKHALANYKLELMCGFQDEKTNNLVALGESGLKEAIAKRLFTFNNGELINNCPECGKIARTPRAKQCKYCGHDWH